MYKQQQIEYLERLSNECKEDDAGYLSDLLKELVPFFKNAVSADWSGCTALDDYRKTRGDLLCEIDELKKQKKHEGEELHEVKTEMQQLKNRIERVHTTLYLMNAQADELKHETR